jgi:hypothetical protein
MTTRILAVFILLIALISFPINKTVDVEINISKHHEPVVRTKATMEEKRANRKMAINFARVGYGWDKTQQECIVKLFTKESRFDHFADNPKSTAYGIGQVLREESKDPATQILRAYRYIGHRYDTPCKAWAHSLRKNWY